MEERKWPRCSLIQWGENYYVTPHPVKTRTETLDRIRHALQFGQHVSHQDACALFEAVTGERVEVGVRCEACGGEAVFVDRVGFRVYCTQCDGSGYSVRPSWMEERA